MLLVLRGVLLCVKLLVWVYVVLVDFVLCFVDLGLTVGIMRDVSLVVLFYLVFVLICLDLVWRLLVGFLFVFGFNCLISWLFIGLGYFGLFCGVWIFVRGFGLVLLV